MKKLPRLLASIAALGCISAPLSAAELPRKASLGLRLSTVQGTSGARVDDVIPGQSGAALGVQKGDLVVQAGGRPITDPASLVDFTTTLTRGDAVEIKVIRNGKDVTLRGKAIGRPLEAYAGAKVDYGSVAFRDGQLRDIMVTPAGVAEPPVLFYIQGFSCASVESPDPNSLFRRFGSELVARGIAYYRVEKVGMGDSTGKLRCADIDHVTELEGFKAAYRHLVEDRKVPADRIFMFGHSLGGMQAPLMAAERAPRGVAVYGTVLRNWADYHRDVDAFQSFLFSGADIVASMDSANRNRELWRLYYLARKSPAEIVAAHPEYGEALRGAFGWDGGTNVFGRDYRFNQQLSELPLAAGWRDTKSNVLAIYGESDIVAINDEDHKLIADMANFWRPGSGKYVELAGTEHGLTLVGNRQEVRAKTRATGTPPSGEFNPKVVEILDTWIKESMAKPPVRLTAGPAEAGPART